MTLDTLQEKKVQACDVIVCDLGLNRLTDGSSLVR